MTIDQFVQVIDRFIDDLERDGLVFQQAVTTVIGEMGDRIFEKGLASDGGEIGQYSTKPGTYARPGGVGKFYEGGYKAFKADIGRDSSKVNLVLTRQLEIGFLNGITKASPTRMQVRMSNKANIDKIEGAERRFRKDIFGATKAERERVVELIEQNLQI